MTNSVRLCVLSIRCICRFLQTSCNCRWVARGAYSGRFGRGTGRLGALRAAAADAASAFFLRNAKKSLLHCRGFTVLVACSLTIRRRFLFLSEVRTQRDACAERKQGACLLHPKAEATSEVFEKATQRVHRNPRCGAACIQKVHRVCFCLCHCLSTRTQRHINKGCDCQRAHTKRYETAKKHDDLMILLAVPARCCKYAHLVVRRRRI